jgi:hypothetical protein
MEFSGSDGVCEVNRPRVFLTMLYLRDRLRMRMQSGPKVSLKKGSNTFKEIAADLDRTEPMLEGVTGVALASCFDRIVSMRRKLEKELDLLTGDLWQPTKFADVADEIVALVDNIEEAKGREVAAKKGKQLEADSRAARVTQSLFTTTSRHSLPPQSLAPSTSTFPEPSSSSSSVPSSSSAPPSFSTSSAQAFTVATTPIPTSSSPIATSTNTFVAPLASTRPSTKALLTPKANPTSKGTGFAELSSATESEGSSYLQQQRHGAKKVPYIDQRMQDMLKSVTARQDEALMKLNDALVNINRKADDCTAVTQELRKDIASLKEHILLLTHETEILKRRANTVEYEIRATQDLALNKNKDSSLIGRTAVQVPKQQLQIALHPGMFGQQN